MRFPLLFCISTFFLLIQLDAKAINSDWLSAPRPNFPPSALRKGSEGSVKLKLVFARDGTVTNANVLKSSGDPVLDETARKAVLKWKMKPSAIKPSYLIEGRQEIIEFTQEAPLAAVHPDRVGYFGAPGKPGPGEGELSKMWMFAPFPSYPFPARSLYQQGVVWIELTIGSDGGTNNIRLFKSSGFKMLDDAALRAVALWRAHRQYAGRKVKFPVVFVLTHRYFSH